MSEITYIPKFLTSDEADALFAACAGLDYGERPMTRGGPARHIGVSFADVTTPRARRKGKRRPLISAPDAIQRLAAKLSAFSGKNVNKIGVIFYRDGDDYFPWHQQGAETATA